MRRENFLRKAVSVLLIAVLSIVFIPFFGGNNALAAETVASGNYEGIDWSIDNENVLRIGNPNDYQSMVNNELRDKESYPWYGFRESIETVVIQGDIEAKGSLCGLFFGMKSLNSVEGMSRLNLYSVKSIKEMCDERKMYILR